MLTAIVATQTSLQAYQAMLTLPPEIEAVEWRVDFLDTIDFKAIENICHESSRPIILTLRRQHDGGHFQGAPDEHASTLLELAACKPNFIDIEHDVNESTLVRASQHCSVIRSLHHFNHTPDDLDRIVKSLQHPAATLVKLVTTAHSSLDALRMLACLQKQPAHSLIAHCMGEAGLPSRLVGKCMGSAVSYAQVDASQHILSHLPTVEDYCRYRYQQQNKDTRLYALIGDPVAHSQGDRFHNAYFEQHQHNAVYIKLRLNAAELPVFFSICNQLPLDGLSVTMPLKEAVMPFITPSPTSLRAINTIKMNSQHQAINTDGLGALDALTQKTDLAQKTVLILGAGGSAAGIVAACEHHDVTLYVYNRTQTKANALAQEHAVNVLNPQQVQTTQFDIIINTWPILAQHHQLEFLQTLVEQQRPQTVFMDIVYAPKNTPFLQLAQTQGGVCVYGQTMFEAQAQRQQTYWMNSNQET